MAETPDRTMVASTSAMRAEIEKCLITFIGSYLEIAWWGRRDTDRSLRMQSPGAMPATWITQRIYTAGESIAAAMQSVKDEELPELFATLDSALTDFPAAQKHG